MCCFEIVETIIKVQVLTSKLLVEIVEIENGTAFIHTSFQDLHNTMTN